VELKLDEDDATDWADIWYPGDISLASLAWIEENRWHNGVYETRTVPLAWQVNQQGANELFVDTANATAWVESLGIAGDGLEIAAVAGLDTLKVKPEADKGIVVGVNGVAVELNANGGLSCSADGLAVAAADGSLVVNGSGVALNPKTDGGLSVSVDGVEVEVDTTATDVVTSVDYNSATGVLSMTKTPLSIQLVSGKLKLVAGSPTASTITTAEGCTT
jgi:hypothetical protein